MIWIPYALVAAVALAAADFFVKLAAGKLSNSLALLIYGSCSFLAGLVWVAWQKFNGAPQFAQANGVWAALGVGVSFSIVTIGLYATFGAGAPISVASPIIRLSGLLLAGLAGAFLLREPLTWRYGIGIALVLSGMYFVVTR